MQHSLKSQLQCCISTEYLGTCRVVTKTHTVALISMVTVLLSDLYDGYAVHAAQAGVRMGHKGAPTRSVAAMLASSSPPGHS